MRYSPPPGYDGNAFSASPRMKMHEAEDEVTRLPHRSQPQLFAEAERLEDDNSADRVPPATESEECLTDAEAADAEPENAESENHAEGDGKGETASGENLLPVGAEPCPPQESAFGGSIQALENLFRHLRGKFGREELILILVMLLVASEGVSIELLLLALLLAAG